MDSQIKLAFTVLIVLCSSPSNGNTFSTGDNFEIQAPRLNLSTQCSETLTEPTGKIRYSGGFAANHRCFWVIRVENTTGYNISIGEFANRHIVSFTGFSHANLLEQDMEHFVVRNLTSDVFVFNHSNLIVVALETDYINAPFGISYVATVTEDGNFPSVHSRDYFLDSYEGGYWVYPTGDLSERTNILSTFIVSPPNNTRHPNLFMEFSIARDQAHNDMSCDWAFYSYFYESGVVDDSIQTWDSSLATCDHPYFSGIGSSEPLLFIFYTESYNRNHTFDFSFESYWALKDSESIEPARKTIKFSE